MSRKVHISVSLVPSKRDIKTYVYIDNPMLLVMIMLLLIAALSLLLISLLLFITALLPASYDNASTSKGIAVSRKENGFTLKCVAHKSCDMQGYRL